MVNAAYPSEAVNATRRVVLVASVATNVMATTRWCPSSESLSWGPHNSNLTMVYGRYIELLTMVWKPAYNWGGTTLYGYIWRFPEMDEMEVL